MNNKPVSADTYQSGLCSHNEPVISAHFMHAQNLRHDFMLYDAQTFAQKSLGLSAEAFFEKIVPLLHSQVIDVSIVRAKAAMASARRNHALYGIKDANKTTASEAIAEVLLDRWFRKGPVEHVNRLALRDLICQRLDAGQTINIVAPLLPNKVDNPLKTRGVKPCMAEINLLCRLAEITETVRQVRAHFGKPATNGQADVYFKIMADGNRFEAALNVGKERVTHYQQQISHWIDKLGYQSIMGLVDYEDVVTRYLDERQLAQRQTYRQKALELYQSALWPVFDAADMDKTLADAETADPQPDLAHAEGRFVPLFKSLLYTYQHDFLALYAEKHALNPDHLYREITQNAFAAFAPLDQQAYTHVFNYFHGHRVAAPSDNLIKEYLRQQMLRSAWQATIEYMAIVKMDRDLLDDPISTILPDDIRMTIHAKPGQIGLKTTANANGDAVQPWHGVAILRPSKGNSVKFDTISRLAAEAIQSRPVLLENNCTGCHTEQTACLELGCQPLFYIHPQIIAGCEGELIDCLEQRLTRHTH